MKSFKKQSVDSTQDAFSLQPSEDLFGVQLAANVEQFIVVPSIPGPGSQLYGKNQYVVILKCELTKSVWFSVSSTAVLPTGVIGPVNVEMIVSGDGYTFFQDDEIHFITPDATAYVGISIYAKEF